MGADVFIVVDVGSGLYKRDEIHSALDVTAQLANFLFTLNTEQQLATLGPSDVLILPAAGRPQRRRFRTRGRRHSDRRERRARGERRLAALLRQRGRLRALPGKPRPRTGQACRRLISCASRTNRGSTTQSLASAFRRGPASRSTSIRSSGTSARSMGSITFESVRYDVETENGATGLVVQAMEKYWGPGYLQFGLESSNDLRG